VAGTALLGQVEFQVLLTTSQDYLSPIFVGDVLLLTYLTSASECLVAA